MTAYLARRILYALPIVVGVNVITFILFFFVNTPDDVARHKAGKRSTLEQIERWKIERGYHLPYFYNDGWQSVGAREANATGWVELPALGPGPAALQLDLRQEVRLTLASDPADALKVERPLIQGSAVSLQQSQRLNFTLVKGASLRLHVALPDGAPGVVVRVLAWRNLGPVERVTQTLFFQRSLKYLAFDFGLDDDRRSISQEIWRRVPPSLAVTVPVSVLGLLVEITLAMLLAHYRGSALDVWGRVGCIALMSTSILFFIILGQWLFSQTLRLVPVSGFSAGPDAVKFVVLPVLIGVFAGLGGGIRWYRNLFLEEMGKDYIRTARMKGLTEGAILYRHALKNAMIPILTGVIVSIPFLIIGSLVMESFFAIPGMGSFMLEAIQAQNFAVVQAMVFLGSVLYIVGLILTDFSYTLVDPRVRLQ
jgi:peptide/nickel transport system permease protein